MFIKFSQEFRNTISNWKIPNASDPEQASATKDMPASENVSSLQSFLEQANYYLVLTPNKHNLSAPLNEILKKDKDWEWTPECQEAFVKIKEVLTSHPLKPRPGHYSCQRRQLVCHCRMYSAPDTRWIS